MRSLFALERLAHDAPGPPARRGGGLLRLLFAPEPLPQDPEVPARRRRGWLRLLVAVEPLGHAPAAAPRASRARGLRSIFAVERIDPP